MNNNLLAEACKGIVRWSEIALNEERLVDLLPDIRIVGFEVSTDTVPAGFDLNIYPAINEDGALEFYLLSTCYDKEEHLPELAGYLVKGSLFDINDTPAFKIMPTVEALKRIENWGSHFKDWLMDTLARDLTVMALTIPGTDLDVANHTMVYAHMALRSGLTRQDPVFWSDLVLSYETGDTFADTVMPVPPFGATLSNAFYLRQHSLLEFGMEA